MIRRIYLKLQIKYFILNIEAFPLVVLEKKIISCSFHFKTMTDDDASGAEPVWIPVARLAGFIKRTTIHCYTQNMDVLGIVDSKKKIFLCLFHCKSIEANGPRGGAISDPRGMLGRIYVKLSDTGFSNQVPF